MVRRRRSAASFIRPDGRLLRVADTAGRAVFAAPARLRQDGRPKWYNPQVGQRPGLNYHAIAVP
jgi:hypothetical protein